MKGTLVSTLQSDAKAEETIERGHDAELGWCPEHDDIAWRYDDDSRTCHWASVVESSCDVPGFIPLKVGHADEPCLALPGLSRHAKDMRLLQDRGVPVDDLIAGFLRIIIRDELPEIWEAIKPIHGNIGEREL